MRKIHILCLLIITFSKSFGQSSPKMRLEDKIRIKEAIIIRDKFGNEIWNEIEEIPFVVLLVSDSLEYLINHPYPSKDFKLSEKDDVTDSEIYVRKRKYSDKLLATFPAVNGVNCIVVGTPEKTNKNSTEWIVTLLHEHFHQYQYTQKDYFTGVQNLNLANGDTTGMWQLNYLFPYEDPNINKLYDKYKIALIKCLETDSKSIPNQLFKKYILLRCKVKESLKPTDYRYFSFQIWQEGIARFTEYKFLEKLVDYEPTVDIKNLPDYVSFIDLKNVFYKTEIYKLRTSVLKDEKRLSFYSLGFAEGILLERLGNEWQKNYLNNKFNIEDDLISKTLKI